MELNDFREGDRVRVKEGFLGTVKDVLHAPNSLLSYYVVLDNGMGYGEWNEAELQSAGESTTASGPGVAMATESDLSVEGTAADYYPELAEILLQRLPIKHSVPAEQYAGGRVTASVVSSNSVLAVEGVPGELDSSAVVPFEDRLGQCYVLAGRYALDHQGSTLVHGTIQGFDKPLLDHAWVVNPDGTVFEPTSGHVMSAQEFEAFFHPQVQVTYDTKQMASNMMKSRHWGPWDKTAQASGVWYHGTDAQLKPGDVLVPGSQVGKENWPGMDVSWGVWITPRPELAAQYGRYVYLVEPLDEVTDWAEENGWDRNENNDEFVCGFARVKALVTSGRESILLPEVPVGQANDQVSPAYQDGYGDATKGLPTKEYDDWDDSLYRADYDLGWADGLRAITPVTDTGFFADTEPDVGEAHSLPDGDASRLYSRKTAGEIWDMLRGNPEPSYGWKGIGNDPSYDWCRFRRNSHCYLPKDLDQEASKQAGYAVWKPVDRGTCWRVKWADQEKCPVGEPGPHVPGGYTDATIPWDDGGQRQTASLSLTRTAAKDSDLGWHITATWKEVQAKAKRIRSDGGVNVVANRDGTIVGIVKGDTNVYETTLNYIPGKYAVSHWDCGCPWAAYAWGRSGPWKRYEGRMCSHALALQYEAQSRGMFGKPIVEDKTAPSFLDSTIPVRLPGDWDRDKGRYSSVSPAEDIACHMLGKGRSYAAVKAHLMALGVADVAPVIAAGRLIMFWGKPTSGPPRRMWLSLDDLKDEWNDDLTSDEIIYPTWDPTVGLTMPPEHVGSIEDDVPYVLPEDEPSIDDDEPAPAVPVAYGDEESKADLEADETADRSDDQVVTSSAEPDPFAYLLEGNERQQREAENDALAKSAAHFLATGQPLSPAERTALIDEGEDVEAGNLDLLDLTGTHYEQLATVKRDHTVDDAFNW